jgi:hypothetical protein
MGTLRLETPSEPHRRWPKKGNINDVSGRKILAGIRSLFVIIQTSICAKVGECTERMVEAGRNWKVGHRASVLASIDTKICGRAELYSRTATPKTSSLATPDHASSSQLSSRRLQCVPYPVTLSSNPFTV